MQIMLEMHSLWSAPAAGDIARALTPYDIYWVEDPIQMSGFASLADLRRRIPQKITASETLAGRRQFLDLVAADARRHRHVRSRLVRRSDRGQGHRSIAEARALPVAPHDCTGPVVFAASCHFSVHAPNALIQERVRAFHTGWHCELVDRVPVFEDGLIAPPDGDGFGLALKPELFDRPDAIRRRSGAGGA